MPHSEKKKPLRAKRWSIVDTPVIPDWEAAHTFLEVARCGSFRSAALKLGQSINVLRRRLDSLERDLGVPLLIRHINGVQLTAEGEPIFAAALQMESASFDLLLARNISDKQIEGEVTLSVSEGLGTGWIVPKLTDFQHVNPGLVVNLRCSQSPPDLLRLEADISVQLERPKELDLKVVKLGSLHMMMFAAKSYLDIHGRPTCISDLAQHRFVVLSSQDRIWEQLYEKNLPGISPAGQVFLRNSVSSTHFSAIMNGAGIGALPTYV
jgi:DNA-binding transcriptional LysR family regulator